jgi:hypothetical protein
MSAELNPIKWRHCGASIRGVSHVRSGAPNQDAIEHWTPNGDESQTAILAISDGHGSVPHVRSDMGARLAAETALSALRDFSRDRQTIAVAGGLAVAVRGLPKTIVKAWSQAVRAHLANNPFNELDWKNVPAPERTVGQEALARDPMLAYGATLLAALVMDESIVFLQIGDGDILCVSGDGATTRPLPEDPRLVANQTTSLCQAGAEGEFRVSILESPAEFPTLIILSTDGYANAFRSDGDFLQIGRDYLAMLNAEGYEGVEQQLKDILTEASTKGSGDDITLGLLGRKIGGEENLLMRETAKPLNAESTSSVGRSAELSDIAREQVQKLEAANDTLSRRLRWLTVCFAISLLFSIASLGVSVWAAKRAMEKIALPVTDLKSPQRQSRAPTNVPDEAKMPVFMMRLDSETTPVPLKDGMTISAGEAGLDPTEFGDAIASFQSGPGNRGLVIVNRSRKNWKVVLPSGHKQLLGEDESILLRKGMIIIFDAAGHLRPVMIDEEFYAESGE